MWKCLAVQQGNNFLRIGNRLVDQLNNESKNITIDDCEKYISDHTFKLTSKKYTKDYPNWPGTVGLEVEMLPLGGKSFNETVALKAASGSNNLTSALHSIGEACDWRPKVETYESFDGSQKSMTTLIKLEKGDNLSFEPGGQLEHSTIPYPCLSDAVKRIEDIQSLLDTNLHELLGVKLKGIGINPFHTVDEVGLQMDKKRYNAMNEYFSSIGPWGKKMMRQTCTIQVCLDFGETEELMAKRYLGSQLLAPFVQAIFAYSPFDEGKLSNLDGVRSRTWLGLDRTRTGLSQDCLSEFASDPMSFKLNKKTCVDLYLKEVLSSNVVFNQRNNFKVPSNPLTFKKWLENGLDGLSPNKADLELQLTLMFPEVRPKGFLELRSPDSQDRAWQYVPAAFYCGLLYDDNSLNKVFDLLLPQASELERYLELAGSGLNDEKVYSLSRELIKIAIDGFEKLPSCFYEKGVKESMQVFADTFTLQGKTPASVLREVLVARGVDTLDIGIWDQISSDWMKKSHG